MEKVLEVYRKIHKQGIMTHTMWQRKLLKKKEAKMKIRKKKEKHNGKVWICSNCHM